ncbi:LrgB family protein [Verrucomicrobium sp. BvORR034]|jgi:predicted murein hydrolase (TIGR00659 family)|uniref:LrgB family protein n=1 Tax=Verrucomicrobium sp. BvORR034 TaxID=1396418 RepID=UPI00224103A6|nr:LrgB family protein [Verrucomicrobium sp. BvORR034]
MAMEIDLSPGLWAGVTLGLYAGGRQLYQRLPRWWTSPMVIAWVGCGALLLLTGIPYGEYLRGTWWLGSLLGPATVAFAVVVHEHRQLIRKHWGTLAVGVVFGSLLALASAWILAKVLHFSPEWQASLLPHSVTTPFAQAVSREIGGMPELTACLVAVTGLFGAAMGEALISWLPLRTAFARGAMLGMGAHGAGTAKAYELGREEGAVAGVIMIMAGLLNVVGITILLAIFPRIA